MKKRVVVIGASGFVGGAIIKALDTSVYQPVSVTRKECDLGDPASRDAVGALVQDGDIIVAAFAKAPAKNWDMLVENITMMTHVVEALKGKKPAYVLNVSSDAVYADSDAPLAESSLIAPTNPHGIMHCMREAMLEKNLSCAIGHIRPTLIYGKDDPHNGYGPNSFLRLAKEGRSIQLFGQGEERRDHIHVDDVAVIACAMIDAKTQGAVNAATGSVVSFMEIARAVQQANPAVEIISKPRSGPMPHNGYRPFDNACARRLCSRLSFTGLTDYLREAMEPADAV